MKGNMAPPPSRPKRVSSAVQGQQPTRPASPLLSIIIINWNSQAFVRKCLASIRRNIGDLAYEILVVDNASFDGCEEMIRSEFPGVVFLQSTGNLGFALANNVAFAESQGHQILFLNPDTEIQPGAIQALQSALELQPDAGMVGARLLNSDRSLQTTCITALPALLNQTLNSERLRRSFPRWKIWGMRPLFEGSVGPVSVQAVSGACMMVKRSVVESVDGFSTTYFMYVEDMDLSLKITRAGWKIYYVPEASIVHHAGGSSAATSDSNFSNLMLRESLVRFFKLYRGTWYVALYRATLASISLVRLCLLVLSAPILFYRWGPRRIVSATKKWSTILGWSIGVVSIELPELTAGRSLLLN